MKTHKGLSEIMRNRLKKNIEKSPFLYNIWSVYKSKRQEHWMHLEQIEYEKLARESKIKVLNNEKELKEAINRRLLKRGIKTSPRSKGNLHIIFAVAPSTWEKHNIPPELQKVAFFTPFYYDEQGFTNYHSFSWIETRYQVDRKLIDFVQKNHLQKKVDVFFSGLLGWHISAETIEKINNMGIITCAYFWDDKQAFRGEYIGGRYTNMGELAKVYDLCLTNAPSSLVKYFVEGGLAIFWPEAANPEHFRPLNLPFEYDVSFIGVKYGQRPSFIKYLEDNGIKVETFGEGWPNGFVTPEKMVEIYAQSRINLGFGGIGYSMKEMCLKGRDFEVPMCGALYITSYHKDIELVYEIDKEIVTYKNKEDCLKKIKWLLENPDICDDIRRAVRERCLRDHTWEKRFEKLFKNIGILE